MKTPYADEWNLSLQQGLGSNTVMSLGYVGSHGGRLDLGGLNNTAQVAAPGTAAQVAARRKYPYIVPTNFDQSTGNSNYHSSEATLRRTTSKGLTYLISYTWSKSIDVACSGSFGSEGCQLQNPYNPRAARSVSGFDLPQNFSASAVYELPYGVGRQFHSSRRLLDGLLGGWNINTIVTLTSGTPYSLTVPSDIANTGNTFVQAVQVGNPIPARRTPGQWINPKAFTAPAAFTFGTFSRNGLRSDRYKDWDASLFKSFPLSRDVVLQLRAEAFNATNTPVFSTPGNSVGSTTFGVVSSTASSPRQLQFAVKLTF